MSLLVLQCRAIQEGPGFFEVVFLWVGVHVVPYGVRCCHFWGFGGVFDGD